MLHIIYIDHNGHYRFMCSNIHNIYPAPTQNINFKADKKIIQGTRHLFVDIYNICIRQYAMLT